MAEKKRTKSRNFSKCISWKKWKKKKRKRFSRSAAGIKEKKTAPIAGFFTGSLGVLAPGLYIL